MERIARLHEFLKETPGDSFLMHALALEHTKYGDDHEARKLFCQILEKEPDYIGSYYHLAKLLERMNETTEALKVYEKGMEMAASKNDRHAYNELSTAYGELKYDTD